jgi:hypothetical protein
MFQQLSGGCACRSHTGFDECNLRFVYRELCLKPVVLLAQKLLVSKQPYFRAYSLLKMAAPA